MNLDQKRNATGVAAPEEREKVIVMFRIYLAVFEKTGSRTAEKMQLVKHLQAGELIEIPEDPELFGEFETLAEAEKELSYQESYLSRFPGNLWKIEQYYIIDESNAETLDIIAVSEWNQFDIVSDGKNYVCDSRTLEKSAEYMVDEIRENMHARFDADDPGEWLTEYVRRDPDFDDVLQSEFNILWI